MSQARRLSCSRGRSDLPSAAPTSEGGAAFQAQGPPAIERREEDWPTRAGAGKFGLVENHSALEKQRHQLL